jgi:hypothetical protein
VVDGCGYAVAEILGIDGRHVLGVRESEQLNTTGKGGRLIHPRTGLTGTDQQTNPGHFFQCRAIDIGTQCHHNISAPASVRDVITRKLRILLPSVLVDLQRRKINTYRQSPTVQYHNFYGHYRPLTWHKNYLLAKTNLCAYKRTTVSAVIDPSRNATSRSVAKYQQFNHGGKPAMFEPTPRIGDWYKNTSGDDVEVFAHEDDDDTLELQYYDSRIAQLDAETWESRRTQPMEPPEAWSSSIDLGGENNCLPGIWKETEDWIQQLDQMGDEPG